MHVLNGGSQVTVGDGENRQIPITGRLIGASLSLYIFFLNPLPFNLRLSGGLYPTCSSWYFDQICSAWHWLSSQWDRWALITDFQCFINKEPCVIHPPGRLAGVHVMTVDHCCCTQHCFFIGEFCSSLFLRHPWARGTKLRFQPYE